MKQLERPIMGYHGGKWRLAPWIISHFPAHRIYIEPFGGAASVLLRKERSYSEVYNDLDESIVNVMEVLRDPLRCEHLAEKLSFTPYARVEFEKARETAEEPVERARRTLIRAQMGFGSAGATQASSGFRGKAKQGYVISRWAKLPGSIRDYASRLQGVIIEKRPALQVIRERDTPETLFYLDPPYLHATRQIRGGCYRYEMTDEEHVELLDVLCSLQGMVILSGYAHPLYEERLEGWKRAEKQALISGRHGAKWRTEVLWISPNAQKNTARQLPLGVNSTAAHNEEKQHALINA